MTPDDRRRRPERSIYTKKGDDGSTGLLYGERVQKDHPRIEACGTIDEAVAALGLARSLGPVAIGLSDLLLEVQRGLFVAGSELATPKKGWGKLRPGVSRVTREMVIGIEQKIDEIVLKCPLPDYFVVPGETTVAAALDCSRAVVRRAERRAASVGSAGGLSDGSLLRYLNRVSDLLFVAARLEEQAAGASASPSRRDRSD